MSESATIIEQNNVESVNYSRQYSITANGKASLSPVGGIAAAKTGSLTTRTDNDTGTVTADPGHGIVTSDKVDLYWDGGSRRQMTATVTVNSIVLDGGSGDNLPAQNTAVTMKIMETFDSTFTGNNAVYMLANSGLTPSDGDAYIVFMTSGLVEVLVVSLNGATLPNDSWNTDLLGSSNPFASNTIAKVGFSHGKTSAVNMNEVVLYD